MKQIHIVPTPKGANREIAMIQNRGTSTLRHPYMTEVIQPEGQMHYSKTEHLVKDVRKSNLDVHLSYKRCTHAVAFSKTAAPLRTRKKHSGGAQSGLKLAGLRAEDFSTSLGPCEVRPSNSGPALRRCPQRPGRRYTFERACVVTLHRIAHGTPYSPFCLRISGFFYP